MFTVGTEAEVTKLLRTAVSMTT